jgi:hypothetical protein
MSAAVASGGRAKEAVSAADDEESSGEEESEEGDRGSKPSGGMNEVILQGKAIVKGGKSSLAATEGGFTVRRKSARRGL